MLSRKNLKKFCSGFVLFFIYIKDSNKILFYWNFVKVCFIPQDNSNNEYNFEIYFYAIPYKVNILGTTNIPLKKSDTDNTRSVQTILDSSIHKAK